jgi:SAM-dependent methyltransferase
VIGTQMAYPCEYVIRMFKGKYPRLDLAGRGFQGKRLCDVGFGDGRNFPFFEQCGFDLAGVEIGDEMVRTANAHMSRLGLSADLRIGTNEHVPFADGAFEFLVSWNACYYMGDNRAFDKHVAEFARVLAPGGTLVLSIPKSTCFIYEGSDRIDERLRTIRRDPFGVRNGQVLAMFADEADIERCFSSHFDRFIFGSIEDDCFGYAYHWHIAACQHR